MFPIFNSCAESLFTNALHNTHIPLSPLQLLVNHPRTDINLKSDGGVTPLIAAVKVVNQFMVNQLLKKNVDIGTTDKDGRTAVHWAAMVDNLEALKLLIRQGPDAIKDAQDSKVCVGRHFSVQIYMCRLHVQITYTGQGPKLSLAWLLRTFQLHDLCYWTVYTMIIDKTTHTSLYNTFCSRLGISIFSM